MKKLFCCTLVVALTIAACSPAAKDTEAASQTSSATDTMPRVTGIGGIFLSVDDPAKTMAWYRQNLGIAMDDYGAVFESRNARSPQEANYLRWSIFPKGDPYFSPSSTEFMINYRVQNIEGLVRQLKAAGVTVLDSITAYEYGKFVHLSDPDGHKIELWEPIDSALTKLGGVTNK